MKRLLTKMCIILLFCLFVCSCTSAYSTWLTLGYSKQNTTMGKNRFEGNYSPPLLALNNGVFIWITPAKTFEVMAENNSCYGEYDRFIFTLWSTKGVSYFDIDDSYFKAGEGSLISIESEKDYNEESFQGGSNSIPLESELQANDLNRLLQLSKQGSFYPDESLLGKSRRVLVKLKHGVSCSSDSLQLVVVIDGVPNKVFFSQKVFTKLDR
ncbi:hypothetical protein [Alteromonas sp. ASW11-130]|uniref:hypothetical protein n=1 Tax=Alteromonas sp. ASW11-130 TaxID=3015775 RepID=UPI0022427330|nr:hypothetical protein [Alteromonas sp. ASW11-130]MCW8090208.1 hypothetical protein [Alteromonas sp. ASW11-130]